VLAGADRPLGRELHLAAETHGPRGLGFVERPDAPLVEPRPSALLEALRSAARDAGEPVVLVTLGPLTNLAHALALAGDDEVRALVASHVAMAGSLRARGTQTPLAEFNVWCDPDAAQLVLDAGLGTRWVGLDVTRQLTLPAHDIERLDRTARDRRLRDALRFYAEFHRRYEDFDGCVINDPVAVAAVTHPALLGWSEVRVTVDRSDAIRRGQTRLVTDPAEDATGALFAETVDAPAIRALLETRVFGRDG
jgi:inosine-uridine nucleoside N-ribohydrolase